MAEPDTKKNKLDPIEQSRKLYETLQTNGIRIDYYEVEGAVHGDDTFYENSMDFWGISIPIAKEGWEGYRV